MNVLVINRFNNMGDTMCQMRGLKEWKDKHPEIEQMHFTSCEYLHIIAALHTDLFDAVMPDSFENIGKKLKDYKKQYDRVIEFEIDWNDAITNGILKAWTKKTLGFEPSTDKPYWIIDPQEALIGHYHAERLHQYFEKIVFVQLEAPSGYVRSFRYEDWEKALDLFPDTVGLVYPTTIDLAYDGKLKPRKNLILLPGYDMGNTAALMKYGGFDGFFLTHGGMAMMAHATDRKNVIHIVFREGGSKHLLDVPEWKNFDFETHNHVNWDQLQEAVTSMLYPPNRRESGGGL